MTIYSDSEGNAFLGDVIHANHSINYPSTKALKSDVKFSNLSAKLSAWLSASGIAFRNVLSQAIIDTYADDFAGNVLFSFGANGDIDDRYFFGISNRSNFATPSAIALFNDSGYTPTNNSFSNTNCVMKVKNSPGVDSFCIVAGNANTNSQELGIVHPLVFPNDTLYSPVYFMGVGSSSQLCLAIYQKKYDTDRQLMRMIYAGELEDINTNYNYYSANRVTKSICFIVRGSLFSTDAISGGNICTGGHYISNSHKVILNSGDAQYPIVCSDGQNTTSQWATDFYVFDNNATLGYPAIGKIKNLLLATGTYTIGKPVKLQGSVVPDNGFNRWLPVGTFAGKTVLMRCYSSVEI